MEVLRYFYSMMLQEVFFLVTERIGEDDVSTAEGHRENILVISVKSLEKPQEKQSHTPFTTKYRNGHPNEVPGKLLQTNCRSLKIYEQMCLLLHSIFLFSIPTF